MDRRKKFKRIAREITGFKEPFELTINFRYFVRKCLGINSNSQSLWLDMFTLLAGMIYYWIPSCNIQNRIIYIPRICLISKNRFVGFLVHEIYHLKFPNLKEIAIETISKREVRQWRESMKK